MRSHIITALIVAAFALPTGHFIGRTDWRAEPSEALIASVSSGCESADVRDLREAPDIEDIRRVVREEMSRIEPSQSASPSASPLTPEAAPQPEQPTPFEERRYHDAEERLLVALDRGVWNDADAIAFSEARAEAGFERTNALVTQLIVAINDGRVHLETEALPF